MELEAALAKIEKQTCWRITRALAGKHEALSLIPSTEIRGCWMLVVHAYNPSYSGGRDQEEASPGK
jgi:hypothetical protein